MFDSGCDPAMLDLFRAEMDTHIPVLGEGLLALEKGRAGQGEFEAMMRAAHSIKGAARIVGIEAAVRVAHVLEDCFSAAQVGRISLGSEVVDVLLQGVDTLQRICSPQADQRVLTEPSLQALLDQIAAVRDARPLAPTPQQSLHVSEDQPELAPAAPQEARVLLPSVLDASAAESLRVELSSILARGLRRMRLDFSQVRQLTAAGLALLASLVRETGRMEPALVLQADGASAEWAALLRTTGMDRTIQPGE